MRFYLLTLLVFFQVFIFANKTKEDLKISTLYHSLNPSSISELFAFHELYPETKEGKKALLQAWSLLTLHKKERHSIYENLFLPKVDIAAVVSLVNKQPYEAPTPLTFEELDALEDLSSHLHHRGLKGHYCTKKEELFSLESEEIDLARALLIYQYEKEKEPLLQIRRYEATIDLMALQILSRLPKNASPEEKIKQINEFIFHEMQFRFPPNSTMAKDIDIYTFLPSVLDSRKGVCLGVSILYLAIAQRINLSLEVITPPGHIYVRYNDGESVINIETTARGINMPTDVYLGINTYQLSVRSLKEVVGMSFINQASVLWKDQQYHKAAELYEQARPFMPEDPYLKMFLGIQYILLNQNEKGRALLKQIQNITFKDSVYKETMCEDIINYEIKKEALEAVFLNVDEKRESIIKKQKVLEQVIKKHPKFRAAHFHLAITWLQLGRNKEGLKCLEKYHELDQNDPTSNYYLSVLYLQRLSYKKSWEFLLQTKKILKEKNHHPRSLKELELQLRFLQPDIVHQTCNIIDKAVNNVI